MSSFDQPHFFYLFRMRNGKRKLSYGASPEDALECLGFRLTDEELAQVQASDYERIPQRDLHLYVDQLG